jgi:PAS domain S-box-containing protein
VTKKTTTKIKTTTTKKPPTRKVKATGKPTAQVMNAIAKSQEILEAIGDAVSIQDRMFRIIYENKAHQKMMGRHIGEYCYKAYPKRKGICGGCPVALTFKDGKTHTLQKELTSDGKIQYLEITASPLRDEKAKIVAGIEIVRDVTVRIRSEERIKQSEKLLSSAFKALDGLLVVLNRDLRVLYSNWKEHDFISEEEKQGYPYCYKIFKHMDSPCDDCPVLRTFADGEFRTYEDRNPVDGHFKEICVSPVCDEAGKVTSVIEYVRDVNERKKAGESLRVSEAKFKSLADESPNMIFINYRGRVVYANHKCEEIMGYTRDEFYSDSFDFRSLIAPEYFDLVSSAFQKHMQGEHVPSYEYAVVTKDGRRLEVIITTKLIDYENDRAILGIITDITERKRNEEAVRRSKAELNKRVKELEEFYHIAVGRELRMIELKREIEALKKKTEQG